MSGSGNLVILNGRKTMISTTRVFGARPGHWVIGTAAMAAVFGVMATAQTAQAQKIVTVVLSEEP